MWSPERAAVPAPAEASTFNTAATLSAGNATDVRPITSVGDAGAPTIGATTPTGESSTIATTIDAAISAAPPTMSAAVTRSSPPGGLCRMPGFSNWRSGCVAQAIEYRSGAIDGALELGHH